MTEIIRIVDIIGGPICVSVEDGQKVFDAILPLFESNTKVAISFEGVDILISAFLNVAVGQLYGKYSEGVIQELLQPPQHISQQDLELLKHVVDNAKRYFKNQQGYDKVWEETVEHAGQNH